MLDFRGLREDRLRLFRLLGEAGEIILIVEVFKLLEICMDASEGGFAARTDRSTNRA